MLAPSVVAREKELYTVRQYSPALCHCMFMNRESGCWVTTAPPSSVKDTVGNVDSCDGEESM